MPKHYDEKEMKLASDLIREYTALKSNRGTWESHWEEVANYVVPAKDNVYNVHRTKGEKKNNLLYDATAIHSNELLASALHSMLTNPSTFWFELTTGDNELDRQRDVMEWLVKSRDTIHRVLNNTNFNTEVHEVYLDLGSFGTSHMKIEEDNIDIIRFSTRPISEVFIAEDERGVVNKNYRIYKKTVEQIVMEYGEENVSDTLIQKMQSNPQEELEVLHVIKPRELGAIGKVPKKFPIASYHILMCDKTILRESGYREMPTTTPRWTKIAGEMFGRSPSMKSLPDIKMINTIQFTNIKAAQKIVDPPLLVPDDGYFRQVRTKPGGLNYYRAGTSDRIEPLQTGGRPDLGEDMAEGLRQRIRSAFFIDQLQLNEGPQMTATEVMQRTEEKLRLLGPILGRLENEFLKPLVNRIFNILLRKDLLPQYPQILEGLDIKARFSSMIARAQRIDDAENITRVLNIVAPLAQFDPTIMDNFDTDELAKYYSQVYGIPVSILRGVDQVQELREQRAQVQQAQAEQAQRLTEAEIVQKAGPVVNNIQE